MPAEAHRPSRVLAWRPPVPGIAEVFHAHLVGFSYPAHWHDTWAVLIVDGGAIAYDLDNRHRGAAGRTVTVLPPGVAHTGQPAPQVGQFTKRELYLEPGFLPEGLIGRAVDTSTFDDPDLRAALSRLHARLREPDPLDVEARLALIGQRLRCRLDGRAAPEPRPEPGVAHKLRAYLDERVTGDASLAYAATALDRSVPHLVRSFRQRFGITPHAYVVAARVAAARRLLLEGWPPARVAVEVGFHDQAHLNRHFTRHVAVPPGRFAAGSSRSGITPGWIRVEPAGTTRYRSPQASGDAP